jgi:chromosome segregation ATPase
MSETTAPAPVARTMTETEAYAIVADSVKRETAALTADKERLTAEVTDLQSRLDIAESAKVAAEQAAAEAVQKHTDYIAEQDAQREAASKKDERIAKVREAASHLKDEFFADEARVTRIVAMKDDEFDGYLADLRETAALAPKAPAGGETPRETAMAGSSVTGGEAPVAKSAFAFLAPHLGTPKEA